MKVLTLDPHDSQLQDGMALLADSALPAELRVRGCTQSNRNLLALRPKLKCEGPVAACILFM